MLIWRTLNRTGVIIKCVTIEKETPICLKLYHVEIKYVQIRELNFTTPRTCIQPQMLILTFHSRCKVG